MYSRSHSSSSSYLSSHFMSTTRTLLTYFGPRVLITRRSSSLLRDEKRPLLWLWIMTDDEARHAKWEERDWFAWCGKVFFVFWRIYFPENKTSAFRCEVKLATWQNYQDFVCAVFWEVVSCFPACHWSRLGVKLMLWDTFTFISVGNLEKFVRKKLK